MNLDRAAREIRDVGLYSLILQDIERLLKKSAPDIREIKEVLQKEPSLLDEYRQLNVEYNISNIHIKDIKPDGLGGECKELAKEVNENLSVLREIEKYTLEFSKSSVLVMIFSVEFFVLFSVQYFIVLLSLKEYQWLIYGLFLSSVVVAWRYARYKKREFERENKRFHKLYAKTRRLLKRLQDRGCIDMERLWITRAEEHI